MEEVHFNLDQFRKMRTELEEAGEKIRVLQAGMAAADEAHGKQVEALQAQLAEAGETNRAMREGMGASDAVHTAQVEALRAQLGEARLGGCQLQSNMKDTSAVQSLQVQALRRQLEQAGTASVRMQAGMEAAEGEVAQLREQLEHAGMATRHLEDAMAGAEREHHAQVAALQEQLAHAGAAGLDLQATIEAADAARNLQVAALQRQLAQAGEASQKLQTGIAAADEARNLQVRELQRQLFDAGGTSDSLQVAANARQEAQQQQLGGTPAGGSQSTSSGRVGQPTAQLQVLGMSPKTPATPLDESRRGETAEAGEVVQGALSPQHSGGSGSASGSSLELLLCRMAEDPRACLIDCERISWCTNPDGNPVMLGEGAFSQVFRVLLDGVQPHAAKVLRLGQSEGEEELFVREACLLKQLRHRNIVGFSGVCVTEDHKGIILMELMEGRDLQGRLHLPAKSGGRLFSWWNRGRAVALDIARAIHYLHSCKLTHFDIKSSNVLLTRELSAKLADVGLTKMLHGSRHSLAEGRHGTFNYMAPELLLGSQPVTQAADLWSFGVLLWELCTGEHPARGCCRELRVPEEAPQEIADLCLQCLDPDPALRPSATELVQRLTRLQLQQHPASASAAEVPAAEVAPHQGAPS